MGLTKVGKRTVWDGPPRKAVPRKPLRNQTTGKARATSTLARKPGMTRKGSGPGWDKRRAGKNIY